MRSGALSHRPASHWNRGTYRTAAARADEATR
ncbi:hypothetical protein PAM7066_01508 [Palleronia marisminoris]|uniref:Uncharacterized protein n=1 Tax=Palleronia marisminoris TaxID=315423 RepID=A0A1Y5S9W9_9RHOB|nr:hypothetical protein PAM7066_01508 [Palleronia marisminoris]